MTKSRQKLIGAIISVSIMCMPTIAKANELDTIDKLIEQSNNKTKEKNENNKKQMIMEMGKGLKEIWDKQKIEELNKHRRRVKFTITYYTNSPREGGNKDKKGKLLENHKYPVVALPKDVPYGTRIEFDNEVLGNRVFINVDSGNAIQWTEEGCVVDVFIANASQKYLNKLGKHYEYGYIYDLGY